MKKDYTILIGIGILSGVINAVLVLIPVTAPYILVWFAGIPYGIVTGIYFVRILPLSHKYLRFMAWVVSSATSYVLAVQATIKFDAEGFIPNLEPLNYAIGGFIGASIVAVAFHFIFQKITIRRDLAVILAGTLLPFALFSLTVADSSSEMTALLYILWQGAITTLLGFSFVKFSR